MPPIEGKMAAGYAGPWKVHTVSERSRGHMHKKYCSAVTAIFGKKYRKKSAANSGKSTSEVTPAFNRLRAEGKAVDDNVQTVFPFLSRKLPDRGQHIPSCRVHDGDWSR
jgi:hypothetical protein